MSETKKPSMFAKLAQMQPQAAEPPLPVEAVETSTPSPAPPPPERQKREPAAKAKPEVVRSEGVKGKRSNPDYTQANSYLPKKLRKAVEVELLDIEKDFSELVEELLRKWLKSRGKDA